MEVPNSPRPIIDYANLPMKPREGIQSAGNYKFKTNSLFLETCPDHLVLDAEWCMSEHEIYSNNRWYPSAWMAFIYAVDEYDALRKICGNVRQWERIKEMFDKQGRTHILESWYTEQRMMQRMRLKESLFDIVNDPASGGKTSAARLLATLIDDNGRGRPKKVKPQSKPIIEQDVMKRVVDFKR